DTPKVADWLEVRLIDENGAEHNPNLDFVLHDTVTSLERLRSAGRTVLLHCVQAQSRTPVVAALYGMRRRPVAPDQVLAELGQVLPQAYPIADFRAALERFESVEYLATDGARGLSGVAAQTREILTLASAHAARAEQPAAMLSESAPDLSMLSESGLFSLYRAILGELRSRGVIRTENAPVGDYAEYLVATALGGQLAPNAEKAWDVLGNGGEKLQVKARVVSDPAEPGQLQLSPFRSFGFDSAVIVLLSATDYAVSRASKVPRHVVESSAVYRQHVNGKVLFARPEIMGHPDATDLTAALRAAQKRPPGPAASGDLGQTGTAQGGVEDQTRPSIDVVLGDVTSVAVDAIVNSANNRMRGGGGVNGAIHRTGGPAILEDCITRFPDGLATGDAGWTTAGNLPARWVIHVVGPNYKAGQRDRSLLTSCYRRALEVAAELGARSVAFPLIGAGVYGWPKRDAIAAAVETIASAPTSVETVHLVTLDQRTYEEVDAELARWTPLRILQGVRVLHQRGYHSIRILPGMSASGGAWRVAIAAAANFQTDGGYLGLRDWDSAVTYSTGAGREFAGSQVDASTSPDVVADLILSGLPRFPAVDDDLRYVEWYANLMRLAEEHRSLPIAYADDFDAERGWEIGWGGGIRHTDPPVPTTA
ncbi:MAG TPA: macro domain-containing protein, partial [Streptosporangiaceae bacterium]|nr:macro domain-containing protein [Streptosporangiaceae bacterium]